MNTFTKILTATILSFASMAQASSLHANDALVLAAAMADVLDPNGAGKLINGAFENMCTGKNDQGVVVVKADKISCQLSNVGIGMMNCDIDGRQVKGRGAYEIYSALGAAGDLGDGGMGSSYMVAKNTACTIDLAAIAECAGGGAVCVMTPDNR